MTPETPAARELRILRERAYGPNADIDESSLRRLRQLESGDPAEGASDPVERVSGPVESASGRTGGEASPTDLARGRRRVIRLPAGERVRWIGAMLLAAILATAAAAAVIQAAHHDPAIPVVQVAALRADAGWEVPGIFTPGEGDSDARGFTEFYGLRAIVQTSAIRNGPWFEECLILVTAADAAAAPDDGFTGPILTGCAAGGFPAQIAFLVNPESPDALRQRFGEGAALQFAYDRDGGDVVVFRAARS